jgi:LysR family hydrogen peroxide-inducible transcriptional activator
MGTQFEYEAGSIETLRRMVELNDGITILPELTTMDMDHKKMQLVRHFKKPAPMREVSVVVHRDFVKKRLIEVLKEAIIAAVPDKLRKNRNLKVVPV